MSNDETQPVSGSRWEQPADPGTPPPATPAAASTASGPPAAPIPTYAAAPPPNRNRGRLLLAGGAVGIALVAGAGGFALGHATAGDDREAGFGRTGFGPNGGPGGQGIPNNGQMPPGFQGGPGGQDGQDGFDPRGDDDGDTGDNQAPDLDDDDGSTQGSSNS